MTATPAPPAAAQIVAPDYAEALARIEAAKLRLADLKAVYSRWSDSADEDWHRRSAFGVLEEMERIAYSVRCYLDGIDGRYLREARAAGLSVVASAEGDGWRPIEGAPKNGTELMLWFPYRGQFADRVKVRGYMYIARWADTEDAPEAWRDPSNGELIGDDPTHWRPLPPPPEGV